MLLPALRVGKVSRTTSRLASLAAHPAFRERLGRRCRAAGVHLQTVSEHGTTILCGVCFRPNRALGASKRFVCSLLGCRNREDRDRGAARKILLR